MTRIRGFVLPKAVRNLFLIVSALSIIDVAVAVLGGSYLSTNIGGFLGKSSAVILSDLLFIEGSIILAIGTFVAVAKEFEKPRPSSDPALQKTVSAGQPRQKWLNKGMLVIILGAILIGLAITVGTLLV